VATELRHHCSMIQRIVDEVARWTKRIGG
jgi:hypothetical protein